jgi:hypothetical protein
MFDPSVIYDEQAGRSFLVDMVNNSADHKACVDLTPSNSSEPTQGFIEKKLIWRASSASRGQSTQAALAV